MQGRDTVSEPKRQRADALVAAITSHPDHKTSYLEWLNLKQAESTNWLDFLQEVNEDLYLILMRRFVNVQIVEPPRLRHTSRVLTFLWYDGDPRWRMYETNSLDDPRSECINLCGVKVYTLDLEYDSDYVGDCCRPCDATAANLSVAAKANGIEVHESWSASEVWKALMSV